MTRRPAGKSGFGTFEGRNPELQCRAAGIATRAITRGILVRPATCERCGETPTGQSKRPQIIGHHDDYSKPLDVAWLCRACHSYAHCSGTPNALLRGNHD